MNHQLAFDQLLSNITYNAAVSAREAIRKAQASAEHIRRSLGQKTRWAISRIEYFIKEPV